MTAPDLRPDEISAAPPTVGDAGFLYHLIAYLVTPLFGLFLLWRGLRDRRYWQGFGERFGFASRSTRPSIWLHAASVGEVQAAVALVRELHARFPTYALVVTTFTVTGRDHARALFKDEVQVQFLPFDLRGSARRFCDRIRPQFVVFFETELWPNLYRECGRRQVPLVIANARLSPRSVRRYRKFHGIFERTLANARLIAAQSEADAERFRSLGAVPAVVRTVGNIKFDFVLKPDVVERGERLRKIYAGARPVWIAGSTHGGEEELILEAHRHVQVIHPTALLILVPRHPDRASQIVACSIARECSSQGAQRT